jgi:tetratricopeptide (TPR) repeat protein
LVNLCRCYLIKGEAERALTYIQKIPAPVNPNSEKGILATVDCYIALDRWNEAEQTIQEGLQLGLDKNKGLLLWSFVLAAQNKHDEAEHQLRKALRDDPDNVALLTHLAELASIRGHYGEVLHCLSRATQIEPENANLWAQLAQLGKQYFDEHSARQAAKKALELTEHKLGIERAQALVAMARIEADTGDEILAEKFYQDALKELPDFTSAKLGLGHLWLQWGRIDEATTLFEAVADHHPIAGYGALIGARHFPEDEKVLAGIEQMAYTPSLEGPMKSSLLFNLAAVYEHRKEYDKAFHLAQEANQASRHHLRYKATEHRDYCQRLQQYFSREFFQERTEFGHPSKLPVFVCGMPRSGTTLVEQILGGHPEVFVAGEIGMLSSVMQRLKAWERHLGSGLDYPECIHHFTAEQSYKFAEQVLADLRRYDCNARYIVDKLPHNFENIGLLRLLFPNAPVIHVLREPRDVAVSNYFINYQAKFGGMGFAYDLSDIGHQLVDYQHLNAHWDETLGKPVLTMRYEDVVDDTQGAARKMLNYLELDWTDEVLNHQNLERSVKTASIWQVRQPIYKTSKEKWRRYEQFLAPLEEALAKPYANRKEPAKQILPVGYFFTGMNYLHQHQGKMAEEVFGQLLEKYPNHAAATHMMGIALMQQNRPVEAITYLEKSIKAHSGHASWYHNTMLSYQALGRTEEAQKMKQLSIKNKMSFDETLP